MALSWIELGHAACWLAAGLSLYQGVAGVATRTVGAEFSDIRRAAYGAFWLTAFAFGTLVWAFLVSDFSVALVANHSHTFKPDIYKFAGTWGNHEGSMLLWVLVMVGYSAVAALGLKGLPARLRARALGVQGLLTVGFFAYLLLASSPFMRLDPAPFQGGDLNPLLQDPALAAHPPMLYLGYVGLSMTFSLAAAALLEGEATRDWAKATRPYALAAWAFLTLGIGLGSYWAYYELGWGGWWFWDPVENASFIPWLVAAALVHSLAVSERRGAFMAWSLFLAVVAFATAMFGAFLVRSGVLTSVHAFALDPERGVLLLGGMVVSAGAAFALFAIRAPSLPKGPDFVLVSREGMLGLNNLVLATAAATVLFGTIFPLIVEAATGRTISVGAPYFNLTFSPLMGAVLIAAPLAPLMNWGKADGAGALFKVWPAAAIAVGAGIGAASLAGAPVWAALGAALGVWLIAGAVLDLARRAGRGDRLFRLSRSVWGMQIAHIGVGLLCLGSAIETGLRFERTLNLAEGAYAQAGPWTVTLIDVAGGEGPNYYADRAVIRVDGPAVDDREMTPERRYYPAAAMPTTEVAIRKLALGDLYIALGDVLRGETGERWTIRVFFKPFIDLVFLGMLLIGIGAGLSVFDTRRRLKPVAEDDAPLPAGQAVPGPAE